MIFKDYWATWDTEKYPASRQTDDKCLNCGQRRIVHRGWRCDDAPSGSIFFDDGPRTTCYVTQSMLNSIRMTLEEFLASKPAPCGPTVQPPLVVKPTSENPQWKTSLNLSMRHGECPCGVARAVCSYHK